MNGEIPGIRNLGLIVYSAYQVVSLMSRRPRIRELQRTGTYSVARWRRDGLLAPRGFEDTSTFFDETILKKECKNNRPVARPARFPLQVGRCGRQRRGGGGGGGMATRQKPPEFPAAAAACATTAAATTERALARPFEAELRFPGRRR